MWVCCHFTVHIFALFLRKVPLTFHIKDLGDDELLELDLIWEALDLSFAGSCNLGCRSLPFMTLNTFFQPFLACKVTFVKSADSLMGTPL